MRRLLIRPGGIGDCLTCFPAMERLTAEYTEVWVPSTVLPLVQFAARVRSIASTGLDLLGVDDANLPPSLRSDLLQFDEIVTWYGSNRSAFRCAALQINPNWHFLPALPPADYLGHVIDFHADLVRAPRGMSPSIDVGECARRYTAVIQPFSGSRKKNWDLNRFEQLARRLPVEVEWNAGPEESLPGAHQCDDLFELAKWICGSSLYIGNDSGITHLAAATGVPTLALFGESDARVWAPRGPRVTALSRDSMNAIHLDDVLSTALRLLEQRHL